MYRVVPVHAERTSSPAGTSQEGRGAERTIASSAGAFGSVAGLEFNATCAGPTAAPCVSPTAAAFAALPAGCRCRRRVAPCVTRRNASNAAQARASPANGYSAPSRSGEGAQREGDEPHRALTVESIDRQREGGA